MTSNKNKTQNNKDKPVNKAEEIVVYTNILVNPANH